MTCPYCGNQEDRVLDSRGARDGLAIRRRRECLLCGRRFTTYEQIEEIRPTVVKRDGRREPFKREKVLRGLYLACRKRPVSAEDIERVTEEIEAEVTGLTREVKSSQIGEMVMQRLRGLDEVAYVRFASVYREFKDATEFLRFVSELGGEGEAHDDLGGGARSEEKDFAREGSAFGSSPPF
jgi:transcriptional repressor NrdR